VSRDQVGDLARAAGIAVDWTDAAGRSHRVTPEVLGRILAALGFPCDTPNELSESRERLSAATREHILPVLVTADAGKPIRLPGAAPGHARLECEDGTSQEVKLKHSRNGSSIEAKLEPGYHRVLLGDRCVTLAVAPARCYAMDQVAPSTRMWGLAVQLYGLRRQHDCGIGDTGALAALARGAARYGADALALSPAHALFAADLNRYGPYSPSSRLFLNPLLADPESVFGADQVAAARKVAGPAAERSGEGACGLIDWPVAADSKFAILRALFEMFETQLRTHDSGRLPADFARFRWSGGDLLQQHACFEALHTARFRIGADQWNWRKWPAEWQSPHGPAVKEFAVGHARDITYHVFLQWIADRAFAATQARMRQAGMRVGLISDLAVGTDSAGSHAWSRPDDLLVGLNIGAPPDISNPIGQNWALTTFSPRALTATGFAPVLATLRAVMRNAGGIRVDHAMALTRLWVIPEGAAPADGAYLNYPRDDLLRLVKLESWRHRAVVIGEDLGTVPEGFREVLGRSGISGMRVLWFERDAERFVPPSRWSSQAVAMTTTHDLPTVAGWWRGTDIDLGERLDQLLPQGGAQILRQQREIDRDELWTALRTAGVARDGAPAVEDPAPVVDAAVRFVAAAPSPMVLLPLEDALGMTDQPNLPGTIDEHPNWRRRYRPPAHQIFDDPAVAARAEWLRGRSGR
jgi:4-alpha-glucanotransferase